MASAGPAISRLANQITRNLVTVASLYSAKKLRRSQWHELLVRGIARRLCSENEQTIDHLATEKVIDQRFLWETNNKRKTRMPKRPRMKNRRRDNSLAKGNRWIDDGNSSRWPGLRYR